MCVPAMEFCGSKTKSEFLRVNVKKGHPPGEDGPFLWIPRSALLGADHDEQGAGYALFVDSGVRMRDACEHRSGFANTL